MQHQSGGSDCGLYSIAFAQARCAGVDPHLLALDQCKMREHLHLCFEEEKISPFPPAKRSRRLTSKRITHSSLVPVYCTCRLPWNKQDDRKGPLTQCNRCKEWFHKQCANIHPDAFDIPHYVWLCATCKKLSKPVHTNYALCCSISYNKTSTLIASKSTAAFIVNPTTIKAKTRKVGTHFFILYLIPTTISLNLSLCISLFMNI